MTDADIQAAVRDTVAAQILEGLGTEARDALLQKSIVEAIGNWEVQAAIRDVVADKATAAAAEMLASVKFEKQIMAAVKKGGDDCLKILRVAVCKAQSEAFIGPAGDRMLTRPLIGKHMQKLLDARNK